jgi:hypothetical protein
LIKSEEEPINNESMSEDNINDVKANFNFFTLFIHKMIVKGKMYMESLKYTQNKKKLMKTPCEHVFHTHCLEKWMEHKHECAFCRRSIPPLE